MKAVRTLKNQGGFSLIELMIVVAIIGILASIAVPNFQKFQRRAKQSEGKGYLASIFTAEKGFQAEWNTFTSSTTGIGFVIDPTARGCYRAGFTAAAVAIPGSTVAAGDPIEQNPTLATGCGAFPALPASTYTTTTFTASTVAILYTGGPTDTWTINEVKNMNNTVSGL